MIEIAAARGDDAPAIVGLHREVLAEKEWFITLPGELYGGVDLRIRQIREFERSGNSLFLLARDGDKLVGFLTATGGSLARMRHACKIEVMVHKSTRGQGVGQTLMQHCVDWAVANPLVHKLGLNVFADNDRAIKLYERFGFAIEGRRPDEYRMEDGRYRDDVLMYRLV